MLRGDTRAKPRALSTVLITVLALETMTGLLPIPAAASSTPVQHQFSPVDVLSGGVWARLTNFGQLPFSAGQMSSRASSPTSGSPTISSLPPSKFSSNFRVTTNKTMAPLEDEPSIVASNETGHPILVIGANSLSTSKMASYFSKDQGSTWMGPNYLALANVSTDSFASDPALGADRSGAFYYAFLSVGYFPSFGDNLVVATSTNGQNFTNHIAVHRRTFTFNSSRQITSELYDKDYLAVGPSKSNPAADAVYATYTDFIQYCNFLRGICSQNSTIMEVHSYDGGATWSKPVAVSPNMTAGIFGTGRIVQGSMPAVAPNGDLYVAYYDSGADGWLNGSASVMIAKSTDGGKTFSAPIQAGFIPQEMTYYSGGSFFGFRWWSSMFPSMDVAPDGTVYISYCAGQNSTTKDPSDVYLVSSTDGGATWSARSKVNDDHTANGQFFSWLKVSKDGVVHIVWGDQRLDPTDTGYDVFYAEATNHGSTISPNSRVTDTGTDPTLTYGFVGDYFNVAVLGNQVYAAWTDGRRGLQLIGQGLRTQVINTRNTDIFMARLGPRTPPTIAFGGVPPAGYFAPVTLSGSNMPRDAFFTMKMNGTSILSQRSGTEFFFTDDQGRFTDIVVPNTDYFGSYPAEADDWISGLPFALSNLVVVDTRSLQVQVTGPAVAFPGDNLTWSVQVASPGGSPAQSASITSAVLILPNGSAINLMSGVVAAGSGAYSISSRLSGSALPGSYTLVVDAAQSTTFTKSTGFGSSTLTVSSDLIATRNSANSAVQQLGQALSQLSREQNLSQSILQQLSATQSQLSSAMNQLSSEQTYILVVGAVAAVAVVLEVITLLRKKA